MDKWRNRYRQERMEKYADHHNPERHRHAYYMKGYLIEMKLDQCRKLKEEIEEIYNEPLPVESPPSDNFYVDKHYEHDPYPIWEPADQRFDSTPRKSYKNIPKSFKNNFNRWQGAKKEWKKMLKHGHINKEKYYNLIGEFEQSFHKWHSHVFPEKGTLEKAIAYLMSE